MWKIVKNWWNQDPEEDSTDSPFQPVRADQKQDALPMLSLAFGWGFLITGLLAGGQLGAGLSFYPDMALASLGGNTINFIMGALVAYIGYKTACNSGLLYQFVYGRVGVLLPVIFIALLITGWQAIIVGAFGFTFAQSFTSPAFYIVAILGGLLFTFTTYFGVKGIERVSLPSVFILIFVGLYAAWSNLTEAGGLTDFLALSEKATADSDVSIATGMNIVVGSWAVGAVVMAEYTRFAKSFWVAMAIPFIVMMVAQWFLQIVGAMGSIVSGSPDFTTYLLQQGFIVGGIGLIGMSLALWTTGNTNLYLPVIQTSAVLKRPKRVMVIIWGLLGTVLGLGLYQHFMGWINLLAALVPPLLGPLVVDFYVVNKGRYDPADLPRLHKWNKAAIVSYLAGAFFAYANSYKLILLPDYLIPSLFGLVVSMLTYALIWGIAKAMGSHIGYSGIGSEDPSSETSQGTPV